MKDVSTVLKKDERAVFELRSLYERHGYRQYKMSKFEEYDFYVRNKDFLISDGMITFNDTDGKLLALKPDVTLSIVKSCSDSEGGLQKLYYSENVYRKDSGSGHFREIVQTGLECIGAVDIFSVCEVVSLAAESLFKISDDFVLDISHMGIISAALDRAGVGTDIRDSVIECIAQKNAHDLRCICDGAGILPEHTDVLCLLASMCGGISEVVSRLEAMDTTLISKEAREELRALCEFLLQSGLADKVRIDFSIVNNMNYYSGIVLCGFVAGVPCAVLSGGEYGKLMRKMGRKSGAIGFAIYMDLLRTLSDAGKKYDVDTVLIYPDDMKPSEIKRRIDMIASAGESVCAQRAVPSNLKYRRLIRLTDGGFEICDDND